MPQPRNDLDDPARARAVHDDAVRLGREDVGEVGRAAEPRRVARELDGEQGRVGHRERLAAALHKAADGAKRSRGGGDWRILVVVLGGRGTLLLLHRHDDDGPVRDAAAVFGVPLVDAGPAVINVDAPAAGIVGGIGRPSSEAVATCVTQGRCVVARVCAPPPVCSWGLRRQERCLARASSTAGHSGIGLGI